MNDWVNEEKIVPIMQMITARTGLADRQADGLFLSVYIVMHGYACMFASNSITYNEADIMKTLNRTFTGISYAMKADQAGQ